MVEFGGEKVRAGAFGLAHFHDGTFHFSFSDGAINLEGGFMRERAVSELLEERFDINCRSAAEKEGVVLVKFSEDALGRVGSTVTVFRAVPIGSDMERAEVSIGMAGFELAKKFLTH